MLTVTECPVLILGNKIDKPDSASEDELKSLFNLHGVTTDKICIIIQEVELCTIFAHTVEH